MKKNKAIIAKLWSVPIRRTALLLGVTAFLFFLSQPKAHASDSLKEKIVRLVDSAGNNTPDNVYGNPNYFKNIPVEQSHANIDSATVAQSFNQMDQHYQSADFDYSENRVNRLSWWDRLTRSIEDFFQSLLPHFKINLAKLFYYLLILIGLAAVVYIVYRLVATGKRPLYRESYEGSETSPDWIEKKLMDINLETFLDKALADNDLRLAIRYLHLINLKMLVEKGHVAWDYKKTNRDFLYEISNEILQKDFAATSRIYEYVWYGGFELSKNQFTQFRQVFDRFRHEIVRTRSLQNKQPQTIE